MVALIKKEVRTAMAKQSVIDNVDKVGRIKCPVADRTGHKLPGTKKDLRARMDINLFQLFEAEAKAEHQGNLSRMLDQVIWTYFNRPRLSFELEESKSED